MGQGGADDELEQRHPSGQQARDTRIPLLHAQVAGVQSAGVDGHEGLGGEALVLGVSTQGGLLAGRVPIEGEDDLAAAGLSPLTGDHSRRRVVNVPQQAAHDPHVVRAEGSPARGHGRGHPGQVGGHDVGVALDDDDPVGAGDLPLGQVQPVEDLALVEDGGLGGVEVLGALILLRELARPEADGGSGDVPDGPDEAAAEAVVDAAPVLPASAAQAGVDQLGLGVAGAAQVAGEVVPSCGRVANAEVRSSMAVEAPRREEVPPRLCLRGGELLAEPGLGQAVGVHEALPSAWLHPAPYSTAFLVAQLDPSAVGEVLDRLGESKVMNLLDESDDVSALTAAEAMPVAELGADVEGGGAFVMEGTQSLERADAGALESHVLTDDVLKPGALAHRLDVLTPDQSRHRVIVGEGTDILRQGLSELPDRYS